MYIKFQKYSSITLLDVILNKLFDVNCAQCFLEKKEIIKCDSP